VALVEPILIETWKSRMRIAHLSVVVILAGVLAQCAEAQGPTVPDGFEISVFVDGLNGVRTLKAGPDGLLYAVQSRAGRIVRIDLRTGAVEEVARGLNRPYGLAFHDGWAYVGETNRIVRFRGTDFERPEVLVDRLPTSGHWTKEIAFGADGMMYVSIGSSCNLCEEEDKRRAAVVRYAPDGSGEHILSEGLRNSAGLAFEPETGALWASQNERDNLGDDIPAEEINILRDGAHYGWPYCFGQGESNPEYRSDSARCAGAVSPAWEIQAHSAPLGMVFYTGDQFPEAYRGDLFVALHGSWNRTEPTGYKLIRVTVEDGRPIGQEDFATGWLRNGTVSGRPVYPEVGPDGALYLSDDGGGRIYRIRWVG
jgi:glucose/arabinose dehydrogenase